MHNSDIHLQRSLKSTMNKAYYNSDRVKNISNEIWRIFDYLRTSIPAEDLHVLLFFLSGYKDGLFDTLQEEYIDLNNDLIDYYHRDRKYYNIAEVYSSIIRFIPRQKLSEIVLLFNRINQNELQEFFPEIFDSILYRISNAQGKNSGEFIQPLEISRLIMNLADLDKNATVYNPFAGLASFATFLHPYQRYYGQEINHRTWALGSLRLMAHNLDHFDYKLEDSIENWMNFSEFDLIVANPPFGIKIPRHFTNGANSSVEMFLIEKSLQQLPKQGQLIAVLPQSFLYTSNSNEKRYREYLVNNNSIDTIISLPSGILKHTSIPICIVKFRKYPVNQGFIKFVDASEFAFKSSDKKSKVLDDLRLVEYIKANIQNEFIRNIDFLQIQDNDYNLKVNRYLNEEDFDGIKLSEIGTFLSGTRSARESVAKLVKIKDLKDDIVNFYLDSNTIEFKEIPSNNVRKIEQDCLLVAVRWKTLKPTYFKYQGEAIYISNDIFAIKIDENRVNINYLINELSSDYVKKQLDRYKISSVIPMIRRVDLFNLKIVLPSLEEQNKKYFYQAEKYLSTKVEEFNTVYKEQEINVNDENSFLRHQIAGSLKNIRGAFDFVKRILEEQVKQQIPDLDNLKADARLETTLSSYINIIDRDLISVNKAVNKAGDKIDLLDLNIEYFDLLLFIKEYAESLKIRAKNLFTVILDLDENAIKEYGISGIQIHGDKDIIRKMFDNLIENAEKHAFTNSINSGNKIKIELLYDFEDDNVQIDISNTGNPLPESISHDSMIRKGSSSGKNAGDGLGIWFVNEVMKIHKGKFSYTDETGPEGIDGEYVTTMELTFPLIQAL
ncbi:N-6 DNA methylase [Flavobacterium sp. LMO9]|nr:N-6 DNA methylase [Flavobacterium sp. LMO9]MQP63308.1 N-6 DNA methylase [Flavobacterium sp. LMO6]